MKLLSILLLFCFGWFTSTPFEFSNATVRQFNAGQRMGGQNVQYQVKFIANKPSRKITFKKMWIGSEQVEFRVSGIAKDNSMTATYGRGDTIVIEANMSYRPNENGALTLVDNGLSKKVKEYKGKAIIEYTYKGKIKEFIVADFTRLETVNYP